LALRGPFATVVRAGHIATIAAHMSKDEHLPRRRSVRLPGFDYSQPAAYFLTICSREKRHVFGEIVGGEVRLSAAGRIVDECWREIRVHFPNVELPIHVVMPNHVHGVVLIRLGAVHKSDHRPVEIQRLGAHPPGSIPVIVRSFKAITARRIRESLAGRKADVWQRGYYERVIRDEKEFRDTCKYIRLNPARWGSDEENL
jgi:putative transposase